MRLKLLSAVLVAGLAPAITRAAPEAPKLAFPVACQIGRTCEVQKYVDRDPGPGVLDYRCGRRTNDGHNGVDIRLLDLAQQRRGVAVLAAAPGRVARLRDGMADISVSAPGAASVAGQECGNGVVIDHGDGWETQYCHLARGSIRVKPGDQVKAGDPIARVGLSGSTEYPHLHMTVRHGAQVVDPFAPQGGGPKRCSAQGAPAGSMWTPAARTAMSYKPGVILNAGFAGERVEAAQIEEGAIVAPTAASPVLVTYMRAIGLQQGDVLDLALKGPDGASLAAQKIDPLDHDKAQYYAMIGRRRPPTGWAKGRYTATLRVLRGGKPVLQRTIATVL